MSDRCDELTCTAKVVLHGFAFRSPQLDVDSMRRVAKTLHVAARNPVGLLSGVMANAVCNVFVRHGREKLAPFEHGEVSMQVDEDRATGDWVQCRGPIERRVFWEQQLCMQLLQAPFDRFCTQRDVNLDVDDLRAVVKAVIIVAEYCGRAFCKQVVVPLPPRSEGLLVQVSKVGIDLGTGAKTSIVAGRAVILIVLQILPPVVKNGAFPEGCATIGRRRRFARGCF